MPNILDTIQVSGASYDLKDKNAPSVSSLTQSEYDNLPATAKTSNTFFVITDAQAGDLTNYYTKTETNSLLSDKADTATTYTKTEVDNAITAATSTKQDTLVSSENIKTINNESILGSGNIEIQGGGKAVAAGTNISITTGATADTINCTLPISAGTNALGVVANAIKMGEYTTASSVCSFAMGTRTFADGYRSFAGGVGSWARAECTFAYGTFVKSLQFNETAFGGYNVSNKANTTWGDSGNTLFSVGNGTSNNARHNAFEIRQNGDIYIPNTDDTSVTGDKAYSLYPMVRLQDTIAATAANTTALGGLSLVKLSQSEYDSLATKDSNTLYIVTDS